MLSLMTTGTPCSGPMAFVSVWSPYGIPTVMPLMVNLYAREDPELFGFPFFFWYQFMWIPLAAGLTYIAYRITTRQEQRDREGGER